MKKPIFLLFALLTALSSPLWAADKPQLLDQVIAVVNDEAITQSELDGLLRPIYEDYRQRYSGDKLYQELNEARTKLLNQLIEDRLVYQEAKTKGVQADALKIDQMIEAFQKRFPTPEAMEKALDVQGVTLHGLRERFEKQEMVRSLHEKEIRSKIVVSPSDIENFYEQNPDEFTEKDRVRARTLTIKKSEEAREKGLKDEQAWQKMQKLEMQIKSGKDFGEIAKENSQDVNARNGGTGDWIERGAMIETIDEVLFKLKPGETSGIIETPMGYHLFRVEEIKSGSKRTLDQVREEIEANLYRMKSEERFNEWMNNLKRGAYISVR